MALNAGAEVRCPVCNAPMRLSEVLGKQGKYVCDADNAMRLRPLSVFRTQPYLGTGKRVLRWV